jgi:8-oxo-dGTP diphosphatase
MKPGTDYIGVGCGALIVNDNNEVLLIKRTGKSSGGLPGLWSRPGGTVEFGESIKEAIIREVKEELNVDIELFGQIQFFDDLRKKEQKTIHWVGAGCFAKIVGGELKNMEPEKHDDVKWFSIENIPNNLTDFTKIAIDEFKKELDKK